jgi:hypothetical protein
LLYAESPLQTGRHRSFAPIATLKQHLIFVEMLGVNQQVDLAAFGMVDFISEVQRLDDAGDISLLARGSKVSKVRAKS